ncbi:MAG: hypothetical protein WBA22_14060 [Candidatus Methanofastidiosia archaeon]
MEEIALVMSPVLLSSFLIAGDREIFEPNLICPEEHEQFTMVEQQEVRKDRARILT